MFYRVSNDPCGLKEQLKMPEIIEYYFKPTSNIPNSPRPLIHYKSVFPVESGVCSQVEIYETFIRNGWDVNWIFSYGPTQASHFHSSAHEVMAVMSGAATIRFGVADLSDDLHESTFGSAHEDGGIELAAAPGDVFLVPAGVAHKTYNAVPENTLTLLTPGNGHGFGSDDPIKTLEEIQLVGFTMIGAYAGGDWDFVTNRHELNKVGATFEDTWGTRRPKLDPVFGEELQGLNVLWK